MEKMMKNRIIAAVGFILVDMGIFLTTVAFLPRPGSWGHSGPWSYFINSRTRWDIAWAVLVASIFVSAGLFLVLEALGAFKKGQGTTEP
jgi:hypothetical protein